MGEQKTITFSTNANDMYGQSVDIFDTTDTRLKAGRPTGGGAIVWIPFTVTLPKLKHIYSATLKLIATIDNTNSVFVKIGFEAADNPSAPANYTDLAARTLTTAYLLGNPLPTAGTGEQQTYDVTTALQEILNRAGWAAGNTAAVLVQNNGTPAGEQFHWASFENATYTEPVLEVVYDSFVPRSGGLI